MREEVDQEREHEKSAQHHGLAMWGVLFTQSLEISGLDDLKRWGAVTQAFIEFVESTRDPILESLVRLKEMTYKRWVKPTWAGPARRDS